jgi:Concanavalin A-like lectin/glucanases superfamily/Immunoglobulin domain
MKSLKRIAFASALFVSAHAAFAYDVRTALVSYYPFESSTTADAAFTNNFTAVGSPTLSTANPAPRGSVLQLSGSGQYLRYDHTADASLNGFPISRGGGYTIAMWVKGAAQTAKYVFASGNSVNTSGQAPLFILQTGNAAADNAKLDLIIRNDAGSTLLNHKVTSTVVFDNTWHHIAYVDNNGTVQIYVDGNLDVNSSQFNYSRSGTFSFDRTAVGTLIRNTVATGNLFNGSIDDLALFERALTQAEVQNIMTNGIATPLPALPPALVSEPVSTTRYYQDAVIFSVSAIGTRPNNVITYQWNRNNTPILDETNRTLRIFGLTGANSGELYSVTVFNGANSVTSSNAVLTVIDDGPPNVASGLVNYWPMDAVTNNGTFYSSPDLYSHNDLFLTNMTEANLAPGQFGNSLGFDNLSNTYGQRTGGSAIYSTNGYSVSMWVKADGTFQSDARVFGEGSTNSTNPLFTIGTANPVSPTGVARIYVRNDSNVELLKRDTTRTVFDNNWHHIVWVDRGGLGKLYIDGAVDESDYTYAPGSLTLQTTAIGGLVRATFSNIIFGNIDEVATWNRPLTYSEVQQIMTVGIPAPAGATPPSVTVQPIGTNVFTKSTVTFAVGVAGTAPFSYQWFKGASPVADATNATLTLTNIQLGDAGNYSVNVSNSAGATNSQAATLVVTTRPAPPASLSVDFNNRTEETNFTEVGFDSFALNGNGPGGAAVTVPTTRFFGGVEVTAGGSSGTTIDSRRRTTPANAGDFTEGKLLQDFVFSPPGTGTDGLDVAIRFMEPNKQYAVTIWSYDSGQAAGDHISDWYANGNLVKDNYIINIANPPTNNAQYQFSFYATSDADGHIFLQGRRDASSTGTAVFLNALRIQAPSVPSIVKQPTGTSVFVNSDVTLYATAVGVGPFTYQWFKDNVPLGGANGSSLTLSNVQLSATGNYTVSIANDIGATNSAAAALNVTARPAPPSFLGIDFNQRNEETNTYPGFNSFTLPNTGTIGFPVTRLFGGVEVTVAGSGGTTIDSRSRASIVNTNTFTEELLLRDFLFSTPTSGTDGIDVTLRFLGTNQQYAVTIWSFDDQNTGPRISDWSANGVLVKDNYTFDGSIPATDNSQYKFSFNVTSDANGMVVLQGRREVTGTGVSVFLNALSIGIPPTTISNVELVGGNVRLTIQTPDSSKQHTLEQNGDLNTSSWSSVTGVTTTVLSPTSLQFEFAKPAGGMRYYRVNRSLQ